MERFDTSFLITGDELKKFIESTDFISEDSDDILSYCERITSLLIDIENRIDQLIESKRIFIDSHIDFDEVAYLNEIKTLGNLKKDMCDHRNECNDLIDEKRRKCSHDYHLESFDPYNDWYRCNKCGEIIN